MLDVPLPGCIAQHMLAAAELTAIFRAATGVRPLVVKGIYVAGLASLGLQASSSSSLCRTH